MCKLYKQASSESGSIIVYIFAAIAIFGVLTFTLTSGTKESVTAADIQKTSSLIKSDLELIQNAIQECVLMYPDPIDLNSDGNINTTDNPNPPYPLYPATPPATLPLNYGTPSEVIENIVCPGQYVIDDTTKIFDGDIGRFFSILNNGDYTVKYFTDAGPPSVIRIEISSNNSSVIWSESMNRIEQMLDSSNIGPAGSIEINSSGSCATNGCLYYYIKR